MSIRLAHEGHVYGLLTVSLPRDYVFDEEEQTLFRTVAADIACAVRRIEMEREQKEMESALRRARDELEVRVKERTRELERLSTKLLDVQEDERKRIAADLHDGIGQSLSAVKFLVENALEQVKGKLDPPELEQLNRLVPMLRHASDEVRTIVMNLRPSVLDDLGILATIRWFCRRFRTVYRQFDIVEEIRVREGAVSPRLKTIVFRILQEAMNNAAKHSQAELIRVSLTKTNAVLELSIEDDGRGFNPDGLNTGTPGWEKGFGITGMKERTELSGGVFRVYSKAGEGTTVTASWHLR
jgi:signal transduction histidine kinase